MADSDATRDDVETLHTNSWDGRALQNIRFALRTRRVGDVDLAPIAIDPSEPGVSC